MPPNPGSVAVNDRSRVELGVQVRPGSVPCITPPSLQPQGRPTFLGICVYNSTCPSEGPFSERPEKCVTGKRKEPLDGSKGASCGPEKGEAGRKGGNSQSRGQPRAGKAGLARKAAGKQGAAQGAAAAHVAEDFLLRRLPLNVLLSRWTPSASPACPIAAPVLSSALRLTLSFLGTVGLQQQAFASFDQMIDECARRIHTCTQPTPCQPNY